MSPRNIAKDRQQREERRQQILSAALLVFTKRGLAATKISDIASAAGLSHGHVYNYFSSKEEMFTLLVEDAQAKYTAVLEEALKRPGPALERLRWLCAHAIDPRTMAEKYLLVLQAQTTDMLPEETKSAVRERAMNNLEPVIALICQGQREEQMIEGDPRLLATMLITLMHNLALLPVRGFEPAGESAIEVLLRLVQK